MGQVEYLLSSGEIDMQSVSNVVTAKYFSPCTVNRAAGKKVHQPRLKSVWP